MDAPFENFSSLFEIAFAVNFAGQIFSEYIAQKKYKRDLNNLRISLINEEIGDKKVSELTPDEKKIMRINTVLSFIKGIENDLYTIKIGNILSILIFFNIIFSCILIYLSAQDDSMSQFLIFDINWCLTIVFVPFILKSLSPIIWLFLQDKIQDSIMKIYSQK